MKICPECKALCRDASNACPTCGVPVSAENVVDGDRLSGVRLTDKYELVECVGEGAMGWVYRAVHKELASSVAVKIMKPKDAPDQRRAQRFKQEARAASRLNHPNIVSVIDFGETSSGLLYLITEFLQGKLLSQIMTKEDRLELNRILRIMSQILDALEEIHHSGLIHRDLKPDNLMVTPMPGGEDFVRILDFGIVKQLSGGEQKLTQHGQLFGTPNYMAPEQVRGQEVTGAADFYSAGVILFEMLTGRVPFESEVLFDVLQAHLYEEPPRLNELAPGHQYPDALQAVLDRALAKKPSERFPDAGSYRTALREAFRLATSSLCPKCGSRVERGARFCHACGRPMLAEALPEKKKADAGTAATLFAPSFEGVRNQDAISHSPVATARLRSGSRVSMPFVKRGTELDTLTRLIRGDNPVVHILGGAGMGKTTLARRAAEMGPNEDLRVLWVEPHPSQVPVSWGAVRSAVGQALGVSGFPSADALHRAVTSRKILGRDLPGLAEMFGLPGPLEDAEPEIRRQEATASAVRAVLLSDDTPGLLVFEDADFYDEPSMNFLEPLAQKCTETGTRLLITSTLPVFSFGQAVTIDLVPLEPEAASALIRQAEGRAAGGDEVPAPEQVVRRARGNPLRIQQLVNLDTASEPEHTLPDLIATRIGILPAEPRRILHALAVLGLEAPAASVAGLLRTLSIDEEPLHLLRLHGFLEQENGQPQGTDFSTNTLRLAHPSMIQAARADMETEVKRTLNLSALKLLEREGAPEAVLAHHAMEGADYQRAAERFERAGDLAFRLQDELGAVQLYRRAVEVARGKLLADEENPRFAELNVKLGRALLAAGDLNTAQIVLKSAGTVRGGSGVEAAGVRHNLAMVVWAQERPMQATHLMYQAIGDAIMSGDAELIARLYLDLARLLAATGNTQTAMQEIGEAVDLVTSGQGPDATVGPKNLWKLLTRMAELLRDTIADDDGAQAASIWAMYGLGQAQRTSDKVGLAHAHFLLADLNRRLLDKEQAAEHFARALTFYRQIGDRMGQAACLTEVSGISSENTDLILKEARTLEEELGWGTTRKQ